MTQPVTEPAVDEMGHDWMLGRIDTKTYFDHVREQADELAHRDAEKELAWGGGRRAKRP